MEQAAAGKNSRVVARPTNIHYEGALLACAKLGLWQRALQMFTNVMEGQALSSSSSRGGGRKSHKKKHNSQNKVNVYVTDDMILSLIRACVRGSKGTDFDSIHDTSEARKVPLDSARDVVLNIEDTHGLPLVARYLNPLASAYQSLGFTEEAASLLEENLSDRT